MILGCMLTTNNADLIGISLPSLLGACDDVLVVDGGSTDGTVETARAYGARVIFQPWSSVALQRQAYVRAALEQHSVSSVWLMALDSDEVLQMSNLRRTVKELEDEGFDHLWIPRRWLAYVNGQVQQITSRPHYPDYQLRLFRVNENVRHVGAVHPPILGLRKGTRRRDVGSIWHLDTLVRTYAARVARVEKYRQIARRYGMPRYYLFEDYGVLLEPVYPDPFDSGRPLEQLKQAVIASTPRHRQHARLRYYLSVPFILAWEHVYGLLGRMRRVVVAIWNSSVQYAGEGMRG